MGTARDMAPGFQSILWPQAPKDPAIPSWAAQTLVDLNLDQVFDALEKGQGTEDLARLYETPLQDVDEVAYRQEVGRDLEGTEVEEVISNLSHDVLDAAATLSAIRTSLASTHAYDNNYLSRGHLLDAAERYCAIIHRATSTLASTELTSRGLRGFAAYLATYRASTSFRDLDAWVTRLREELGHVEYCMLIDGTTVKVRAYEGQESLTNQIEETFARFGMETSTATEQWHDEDPYATHIEADVLDLVANAYKDEFADLTAFCRANAAFIDPIIERFAREVRFYLAWLGFVRPLRDAGLPLCYPAVQPDPSDVYVHDLFDVALASHIHGGTVANDLTLAAPERMIVVTGPNQGGKTTFARSVGQACWLAALGLNIPGSAAVLPLPDAILTHFGTREDATSENGKLQDDLIRLKALLGLTTRRSVLVVNEIFSSTTADDALLLGRRMMDELTRRGCMAVVVTFLDELAEHGPETVSMMSTVRPDDPSSRTFHVIRKPPDGLAYAICLARLHHVTLEQIEGRLEP